MAYANQSTCFCVTTQISHCNVCTLRSFVLIKSALQWSTIRNAFKFESMDSTVEGMRWKQKQGRGGETLNHIIHTTTSSIAVCLFFIRSFVSISCLYLRFRFEIYFDDEYCSFGVFSGVTHAKRVQQIWLNLWSVIFGTHCHCSCVVVNRLYRRRRRHRRRCCWLLLTVVVVVIGSLLLSFVIVIPVANNTQNDFDDNFEVALSSFRFWQTLRSVLGP